MADKRGISGRALGHIDNTSGTPAFLFHVLTTALATGTTTVKPDPGLGTLRIIDCWCRVRTVGSAADTIQLFASDGTTAITDAIDINDAADTQSRAATISDATMDIAKGSSFVVKVTDGGGSDVPATDVYILCVKV